jgi:LuxR family maltose regulon positive regulatory protein
MFMPKVKQYNTKSLFFPNRITKVLERILDHPLTIIEAPMGYGKTTAVREYLSNAEVNMLWQRVYDSGVVSFWNGFAKLFSDLDNDRSQSLIQLGFPDDAISIQEAIKLVEDIRLPEKTVLVIDDYHLIDSPGINSFIEFLVEHEIDNLHIVLTVRYVKFQRLEELALKGYLHHIKKEIFELKPKEIMGYYKTCGIFLSEYEAQQLYVDTEGWISALYLLMLEYVSEGTYTPVGSIYKLIEKAVYIPLPDEIKEFLVTMCIFDSFTLKQAAYMWGKENAAGFLEELAGNNSFVTYDSKLKTYNIHSIFTGFLKEVFEGKEISHKQNLYRQAAQWFMQIGDCLAARCYFYECGDFDGILLAMEEDKSSNYTALNKDLLKKYMSECPEKVKSRHHYALLTYAMHLFVHKELELFHKTCNELSVNIEKDDGINSEMRNRFSGELELLLSFAEFNDLKKMSARHQKAWQLLNQATSIFDAKTNWTFGTPSVLSLYYRESGRLEEHIQDLKEGLPYYYRLTNGHGSGAEYAMEAESYFNQGDFENAEISVQKALLKAQLGIDENIIFSAEYLQILIAFMKGDLSSVMNLLNKMHEDMISRKEYHFIHTVEICEGCIYAYLDQKDKISERLLDIDLGNSRLRFPAYPFFNVMYGRVLLIRGEYLKLIGSAEHFISISSVYSNLLGYVYTYIYLAAAYKKIYREDEALSNLKKALEIAMPDKQYMLFAENGDYIESLLEKIAAEGSYREEIGKILVLYKTFKRFKEQMILEYFTDEKPKLTQRELEIARLAATGKTNIEIGKQLFISSNTVKMALKSIYTKLSINNRVLLQQHFDDLDQ